MELTPKQIRESAERVIEEYGEDYEQTDLMYSAPCLVGAILHERGLDLEPLITAHYDGEAVMTVPWKLLLDLDLSDEALGILEELQDNADAGIPWHRVVKEQFA